MDDWRPVAPADEPVSEPEQPSRGLAARMREVRALVHWLGPGRILTTVITIPAIAVGAYLLVRTPAPPVEAGIEYATIVPAQEQDQVGQTSGATQVMVHVAGHVYSPGVYALDTGQRIVDAIRAAGGAQPIADLNTINLALLVKDGDQVYVPAVGEVQLSPATGRIGISSATGENEFPVNINSATAPQLDSLPGIGPSTAAAIVGHRDKFGPFASTSGLLDVAGIGPAKFEAIKDLVTT